MTTITVKKHIDARNLVKTPFDLVCIRWIVDGSTGCTTCEAWRGQGEIEALERAGYVVTSVEKG